MEWCACWMELCVRACVERPKTPRTDRPEPWTRLCGERWEREMDGGPSGWAGVCGPGLTDMGGRHAQVDSNCPTRQFLGTVPATRRRDLTCVVYLVTISG